MLLYLLKQSYAKKDIHENVSLSSSFPAGDVVDLLQVIQKTNLPSFFRLFVSFSSESVLLFFVILAELIVSAGYFQFNSNCYWSSL
jgi:hypothetical protein